ncbi:MULTISPECIES: hypothetical protein [Bacillus]|uniref:Fur-regulated basic protein FbpA n=1 Tax=Bacillus capparidis TaxID=1840411 RepID=A0ABS4CUX9_9BACI|nr:MULTISPECIES: hypothetical protein [Bacillus]MBP1080966.1 hypothetical protein [Bacillus capparidis]MED1095667.1 hypothetical protein [Bacillus capparidis]
MNINRIQNDSCQFLLDILEILKDNGIFTEEEAVEKENELKELR